MKRHGTILVWLAGCLALCAATTARATAGSGNPYEAIVERNVFGLKPPPPPPDPEANKPPLPKITLTGIITLGGTKRALMKTPPPPAKPGEAAKTEEGFILAVGERQGEIEVLDIDENVRSVKVNYGGTVTELTFEKNGVKTPAAAAPGAAPPLGMPQPTRTVRGAVPGVMGGRAAPASFTPRPLRLPGASGAVSPQSAVGAELPSVSVGGTTLGLSGANASVNPSVAQQPAVPQRSAEENFLLLEAARLMQQQTQAGPIPPPPLPRSPLADQLEQGAGTGASAPAPAQQPRLPIPPGGPQPYRAPQ